VQRLAEDVHRTRGFDHLTGVHDVDAVVVPVSALAAFQMYLEFGLHVTADDVYWNAADPGWAYGLYYSVLAPLAAGRRALVVRPQFSPAAAWAVLDRYRVSNLAAAPTVYRAMRAEPPAAAGPLAVRRASSAGEPLTPDVNEWAPTALGTIVHDHFGQTETGMVLNNHHHPLLARPVKPGSMGRPMPGWSVDVLRDDADETVPAGVAGRIAIDLTASPLAWFRGYVDESDRTTVKFSNSGRWCLTGDTGSRDDDGAFRFSARDDDVIIMAGYRIGPFDVESVLTKHPAVAECAVIASPDQIRGEVLEAYVVLLPGQSVEPAELQQWGPRRLRRSCVSADCPLRTAVAQDGVRQGATARTSPAATHRTSGVSPVSRDNRHRWRTQEPRRLRQIQDIGDPRRWRRDSRPAVADGR
jgi:acetyl-CoA synthetase